MRSLWPGFSPGEGTARHDDLAGTGTRQAVKIDPFEPYPEDPEPSDEGTKSRTMKSNEKKSHERNGLPPPVAGGTATETPPGG